MVRELPALGYGKAPWVSSQLVSRYLDRRPYDKLGYGFPTGAWVQRVYHSARGLKPASLSQCENILSPLSIIGPYLQGALR